MKTSPKFLVIGDVLSATEVRECYQHAQLVPINLGRLPWLLPAIQYYFGYRVNYAQLIKVYRSPREGEQRYSPGEVSDVIPVPLIGTPHPDFICTSHIERQNLTMRMQMRRLTRLTNAFCKKWENLNAALGLRFAFYNFCRVHKSLRVTPALEAGMADHVWTIQEVLALNVTQDK